MWRYAGFVVLLGSGPCLPQGYFSDLLASSLTASVGVLLSDFFAVVLPPVT